MLFKAFCVVSSNLDINSIVHKLFIFWTKYLFYALSNTYIWLLPSVNSFYINYTRTLEVGYLTGRASSRIISCCPRLRPPRICLSPSNGKNLGWKQSYVRQDLKLYLYRMSLIHDTSFNTSLGTGLLPEREVFVRDSHAGAAWIGNLTVYTNNDCIQLIHNVMKNVLDNTQINVLTRIEPRTSCFIRIVKRLLNNQQPWAWSRLK